MTTSYSGAEDAAENRRSVGDLLSNVSQDVTTLLRQEVALAKAEIQQSATRAGKGVGMFAGAGVAGHMVLLFVAIAGWWALGDGIGRGWAALVVALVWAVIAAVLGMLGRSALHVGRRRAADRTNDQEDSECSHRQRGDIMTAGNDPDEIRAEIERTRMDLSDNVNALADTVNPAHVAKRQADKVKGAVLGTKDKVVSSVMGGASSAADSAHAAGDAVTNAPSRLTQQASGAPLAAGLIAFGLGLLGGSLLPASSAEKQAADKVKHAATPVLSDAAKDVASNLQQPAQHAVDAVKHTATDAVETVKDESASAAHDVKAQAQDAKDTVQQS